MRILQVLAFSGAFVSFVLMLRYSVSITEEVNEALGTNYERLWSTDGNKIWNEHRRAFPSSRKRFLLGTTLSLAFGLLFVAPWLTPR